MSVNSRLSWLRRQLSDAASGKHEATAPAADTTDAGSAYEAPPNAGDWRRLAAALRDEGDIELQIKAWQAAVAANPDDLGAHEQLAALLDPRDREAALPHLEAIARLTPNKTKPWRRLGKRLQDLGRLDAAVEAWSHSLALAPDDLESHRRLGQLHYLRGDSARGDVHVQALLRLDPEPPAEAAASEPQPSPLSETPMISAVILSLDGAALLEQLFGAFHAYNRYPNLELIVIDHGSTDDTAAVLDRWSQRLPIRRIMRDANYSFAASCNLGVREAKGDLILLLNNDVVFHQDVLGEMVRYLAADVGIVGLKQYDSAPMPEPLLRPYHIGVRFQRNEAKQWLQPRHLVPGQDERALASRPAFMPAVTASVLLCRKRDYEAVGGLDEGYWYGLEDIDFCLKMRLDLGKAIISLNSRSAFHVKSTTRRVRDLVGEERTNAANEALFRARWEVRVAADEAGLGRPTSP